MFTRRAIDAVRLRLFLHVFGKRGILLRTAHRVARASKQGARSCRIEMRLPRAQIDRVGMQYGGAAMMSEQQREAQKAAWRDPAIRARRTEAIRAARRQAGRAANPLSTNGTNGKRAKSPTLRLRPKA